MNYSLSGNDTITVGQGGSNNLLTSFADKDYGKVTVPNELASMKVGKNGNAVISYIPSGNMGKLTLRLLLGSSGDKLLNSYQRQWITNPTGFVLLNGQLVKQTGDGAGNTINIVYQFLGGVCGKIPEASANADGDEEQGVAVWEIMFAYVARQQ